MKDVTIYEAAQDASKNPKKVDAAIKQYNRYYEQLENMEEDERNGVKAKKLEEIMDLCWFVVTYAEKGDELYGDRK